MTTASSCLATQRSIHGQSKKTINLYTTTKPLDNNKSRTGTSNTACPG